jgi:hypothetical protein
MVTVQRFVWIPEVPVRITIQVQDRLQVLQDPHQVRARYVCRVYRHAVFAGEGLW